MLQSAIVMVQQCHRNSAAVMDTDIQVTNTLSRHGRALSWREGLTREGGEAQAGGGSVEISTKNRLLLADLTKSSFSKLPRFLLLEDEEEGRLTPGWRR